MAETQHNLWKFNRWYIVLFASFILFVLPYMVLAFYSIPAFDDYIIPVYVRETGGWWNWMSLMFHGMSGRYFATLIYVISPTNYNPELYFLVPLLLILLSLFTFYKIIKEYTNYGTAGALSLSFAVFGFLLGLCFSPYEMLYWNAASLCYFSSFLSILWFLYFWFKGKNKVSTTLLLTLFLIIAVGTNEISVFYFGALLTALILWTGVRGKFQKRNIILMVVYAGIVSILLFTSGNQHRLSILGHNQQVLPSLLKAMDFSIKFFGFQFQSVVFWIVSISFLIALSSGKVSIRQQESLRNISVLWILLFIVLSTYFSYFLSYYALGTNPAWRLHSIIQFHFFISWLFLLLKLELHYREKLKAFQPGKLVKTLCVLAFVWFSVSDFSYRQEEQKPISYRNNTPKVWMELLFKAGDFSREYKERKLKMVTAQKSGKGVVFKKFSNPPELLLSKDMSEDSTELYNEFYARYYGLPYVKVVD